MTAPGFDLRQEIMRVNNNVNIALFGTGLRKQRVMLVDCNVLIMADHKRIPALAALDRKERMTTRFADMAILDEYKLRLKDELVSQLHLPVVSVLKDYDPDRELAVTVIILEEAFVKKHLEQAR